MGSGEDDADGYECYERDSTLCHDIRGNAHFVPERSD